MESASRGKTSNPASVILYACSPERYALPRSLSTCRTRSSRAPICFTSKAMMPSATANFAASKNLVQWLGKGGEIQRRAFGGRVVERELLAEDRLAAPGHPHDEVDRVLEEAALQDLVESRVAAWEALDQRVRDDRRDWCVRALVPSRSLTDETSASGSRGLGRKAAAPRCRASSALSIAAT